MQNKIFAKLKKLIYKPPMTKKLRKRGKKPALEDVKLAINFGMNANSNDFPITTGISSSTLDRIEGGKSTPSVNQANKIIAEATKRGWKAPARG